jgi:imidazolonepropionase
MAKILIKNIKELFLVGDDLPPALKGKALQEIQSIENAYLAIENELIVDYGSMYDLLGITDWNGLSIIDAQDKLVLPAFCDSHTHTVFARSRETEFVDKIHGLTYEQIASKGGGILNSARVLQKTDEEVLYQLAYDRLNEMLATGTGAVEIKSGYGLTQEAELKMLRVIKRLKESHPITIKATFLGAHAYPTEYRENHRAYLDLMIALLPTIADEQLADYIDVFCELGYFSIEEMQYLMTKARDFGLIPKVHVNQFNAFGGVQAAIDLGALSVDHLEELNDEDISALQNSSCMPTLLPSCSFFLNIPFGQARTLLNHDLPLALATDFNPGTTPSSNMMFIWSLACIKLRLTPQEALSAMTLNGAYAMGLSESHGSISRGKKANIIITDTVPSLAYLPYSFGKNCVHTTILNGQIAYQKSQL